MSPWNRYPKKPYLRGDSFSKSIIFWFIFSFVSIYIYQLQFFDGISGRFSNCYFTMDSFASCRSSSISQSQCWNEIPTRNPRCPCGPKRRRRCHGLWKLHWFQTRRICVAWLRVPSHQGVPEKYFWIICFFLAAKEDGTFPEIQSLFLEECILRWSKCAVGQIWCTWLRFLRPGVYHFDFLFAISAWF